MEGLIILILIIGATVGFVLLIALTEEESKRIGYFGVALLITSLFMLIYPSYKLAQIEYVRPKPYVTHQVMALADGNMMTGRIYLRSGYINENHHYLYGYKTVDGGMKTQKVLADTATVFFDDSVKPCAKWYKEEKHFWYMSAERYACEIYVPSNSLAADFTIDLK